MEFFGDEIDRISEINVVTGTPTRVLDHVAIYPATHYVASKEKMAAAIDEIYRELDERVAFFKANDKLLEAQRISPAHPVRHRDDAGAGLLLRH